jgi:hypothetical protein
VSGAIRRFVYYAGVPIHSRVKTRRHRALNSTLSKALLVVIGVARELPADGFRVRTATATIGAAAFAD